MPKIEEAGQADISASADFLRISVIIAARNEARNLPACLDSLRGVGEVWVIDSNSTDETAEIARLHGAKVAQFHYHGGWPKKRQWAMDRLPLAYDWVLLLDADEFLTPELAEEIRLAIQNPNRNGYFVALQMFFLGQRLRHSGASFYKLSLFRRGKGRFECRLRNQDTSMCDMEVHEHIMVEGPVAKLKNPLLHRNLESVARYIEKHNEYSNWEAAVWSEKRRDEEATSLSADLFGSQAQRRRWLKTKFFSVPGSPFLFFLYKYVFGRGFLDGTPGLIYCGLQGVQLFHIKAKIYELHKKRASDNVRN
ncbi:MAG TPA: glycosyltransferase family 2 protein [Terriglobales bacterium]|nr:glycosyltransferase family 2 protein [Terriglobales bacterium]